MKKLLLFLAMYGFFLHSANAEIYIISKIGKDSVVVFNNNVRVELPSFLQVQLTLDSNGVTAFEQSNLIEFNYEFINNENLFNNEDNVLKIKKYNSFEVICVSIPKALEVRIHNNGFGIYQKEQKNNQNYVDEHSDIEHVSIATMDEKESEIEQYVDYLLKEEAPNIQIENNITNENIINSIDEYMLHFNNAKQTSTDAVFCFLNEIVNRNNDPFIQALAQLNLAEMYLCNEIPKEQSYNRFLDAFYLFSNANKKSDFLDVHQKTSIYLGLMYLKRLVPNQELSQFSEKAFSFFSTAVLMNCNLGMQHLAEAYLAYMYINGYIISDNSRFNFAFYYADQAYNKSFDLSAQHLGEAILGRLYCAPHNPMQNDLHRIRKAHQLLLSACFKQDSLQAQHIAETYLGIMNLSEKILYDDVHPLSELAFYYLTNASQKTIDEQSQKTAKTFLAGMYFLGTGLAANIPNRLEIAESLLREQAEQITDINRRNAALADLEKRIEQARNRPLS